MTPSSLLYIALVVCWLGFVFVSLHAYEQGRWRWQQIRIGLVGAVLWTAFALTRLVEGTMLYGILVAAGLSLVVLYVRDRREREPKPMLALPEWRP
ncbi:hypothetical protein [Haloarchaeobius sp. TZWWS8]|uniref:hypothetical protein n=1 Tax=Haloarchaeobius sp. TZWWS8 TaxID=3446121 RepID=UPI003EBF8048